MAISNDTEHISKHSFKTLLKSISPNADKKEIREAILKFKKQNENQGDFEVLQSWIEDDKNRLAKLTAEYNSLCAEVPTLKKVSKEKYEIYKYLERYFVKLSKDDENYKTSMEEYDSARTEYRSAESDIKHNYLDQAWVTSSKVSVSFDIMKGTQNLNFLKNFQNSIWNNINNLT